MSFGVGFRLADRTEVARRRRRPAAELEENEIEEGKGRELARYAAVCEVSGCGKEGEERPFFTSTMERAPISLKYWRLGEKTEQEAIFGHVSKRLSDHDQRRGGDRTSQTLEEVEANTEIWREERERRMGW